MAHGVVQLLIKTQQKIFGSKKITLI